MSACSPLTPTQLEQICREERQNIPKSRCANLMASSPRRVKAVTDVRVALTEYWVTTLDLWPLLYLAWPKESRHQRKRSLTLIFCVIYFCIDDGRVRPLHKAFCPSHPKDSQWGLDSDPWAGSFVKFRVLLNLDLSNCSDPQITAAPTGWYRRHSHLIGASLPLPLFLPRCVYHSGIG